MNTELSEEKEQIGYSWSSPLTRESFDDVVKRDNNIPYVRDFPLTDRKECTGQLIFDKRDSFITDAILIVRLRVEDIGRVVIYRGPIKSDIPLFLPVSEDRTPIISAYAYHGESRRIASWTSMDPFYLTCDDAPIRILLLNYFDMERGGSTLVVERSGAED